MVVCACCDAEDGVLEARSVAAHAEDVLLPDVCLGHDVQGQQDGTLRRPRLAGDVSCGAAGLRLGEGNQRDAAQDGSDAGCFANVRSDVVGGDACLRQAAQREVQQRRVRVLGVALERVEGRVRRVAEVLLARVDDAVEPVLAEPALALGAGVQARGGVGEQDGDGFLGGRAGQRFGDGVAPELHAHHADGRRAGRVGHAGDVDVEGADGEVGIARRLRDEGLQDV